MTIGMLAIAIASTLYLRHVGEDLIDPRNLLGANASDLGQHLFTLLGCYELGANAIATAWGPHPLRYWRPMMAALAVGLVLTYRLGREWTVPAEEFALTDAASLVHDWISLAGLIVAFGVVSVAAAKTMKIAPCRRNSMVLMYLLGAIGIACPATVGILLIIAPAWIQRSYHDFAAGWTIPALIILGLAGIPGLLAAWRRRNEPRG